MDLAAAVAKYLALTGGFDRFLHLSQFGLPRAEIEQIISVWDEDYQISRYMRLSRERDEDLAAFSPDRRIFLVNGFECTHLAFHPDIQKLL